MVIQYLHILWNLLSQQLLLSSIFIDLRVKAQAQRNKLPFSNLFHCGLSDCTPDFNEVYMLTKSKTMGSDIFVIKLFQKPAGKYRQFLSEMNAAEWETTEQVFVFECDMRDKAGEKHRRDLQCAYKHGFSYSYQVCSSLIWRPLVLPQWDNLCAIIFSLHASLGAWTQISSTAAGYSSYSSLTKT